jgi:uncharacterized protein
MSRRNILNGRSVQISLVTSVLFFLGCVGTSENNQNDIVSLHSAVKRGDSARVAYLLNVTKVNPNAVDGDGHPAIYYAESTAIVDLLADRGANLDAAAPNSHSALLGQVFGHQGTIVAEALLKRGANPNACDSEGNTALYWAVHFDDQFFIKLLLEHKADPNAQTYGKPSPNWRETSEVFPEGGRTPLMIATSMVALQLLLAAKANPNIFSYSDESPLSNAVFEGREDFAAALLHAGANPNKKCGLWLEPPLVTAARRRNLDSVRLLLSFKADVNGTADYSKGETALHQAAIFNDIDLARILLERGADPDLPNAWKSTPLHHAAYNGSEKVVDLLLTVSRRPTAPDLVGRTPEIVARNAGHLKIADKLKAVTK